MLDRALLSPITDQDLEKAGEAVAAEMARHRQQQQQQQQQLQPGGAGSIRHALSGKLHSSNSSSLAHNSPSGEPASGAGSQAS